MHINDFSLLCPASRRDALHAELVRLRPGYFIRSVKMNAHDAQDQAIIFDAPVLEEYGAQFVLSDRVPTDPKNPFRVYVMPYFNYETAVTMQYECPVLLAKFGFLNTPTVNHLARKIDRKLQSVCRRAKKETNYLAQLVHHIPGKAKDNVSYVLGIADDARIALGTEKPGLLQLYHSDVELAFSDYAGLRVCYNYSKEEHFYLFTISTNSSMEDLLASTDYLRQHGIEPAEITGLVESSATRLSVGGPISDYRPEAFKCMTETRLYGRAIANIIKRG